MRAESKKGGNDESAQQADCCAKVPAMVCQHLAIPNPTILPLGKDASLHNPN